MAGSSVLLLTADVAAHWPKLMPNRLVVFHDAAPSDGLAYNSEIHHCPGITEVCHRLQARGVVTFVALAGSALVMKKFAEISAELF